MIKSMTGYGRCEHIDENRKIVIDIRSVNHRYCDITVKVPRAYGYLEEKIKEFMSGEISRGKVEIFVYIENYTNDDKVITLDHVLSENYYNVLKELKETYNLKNEIGLSDLSRFSDIFITRQQEEDKDKVWELVSSCLKAAVEDFVAMRLREGERLRENLAARAEAIQGLIAEIETRTPQIVAEYSQKLKDRMTELLGNFQIDESRLLTEVGIMADRVCIDEELVRLKSHFTELEKILALSEPVGRKLDFLVQEINRETNTIGSKANDFGIAKNVVEIKSEIEKLREQIQNIE
ncbi:YicC/YloC family endoribonuclease [Congzhengia sp.]|uniref:YicC/YloC family endoribonuclease n=1 Tax=Congzhengia sp. TaxID=2944168 RepID=UPI003077F982